MYSQGAAILRADLRGVVEEAFMQSELYIGAKTLPPLPVPNKAGQYPYIGKASAGLLKNNAKRRGSGTTYNRTNRAYTTDTFTCIEYGSEAIVPDDQAKDVGRFFDLESSETRWKYRDIQLAHELRVKTKIYDPSVFSLTTAATAYTEANAGSFDVGLDIDNAKQQIAARGESAVGLTAVMSLSVFNRIRASTRLQNRVRGMGRSTDTQLILDAQMVADALQLSQVLVGAAAYDTSGEAATTVSMSNIWSDTYIWLGQVKPAAGPQDYFAGGSGYTLFWQEDADIFQVESYREENIRASIIRARQYTDEKIINASSGQLLVTVYS